ncbi:MAG: type II toxin-antitoxin system PemK/MazF family toxin [Actinobacteria bacterium]|nr:type II toxin-antitoxin system PemK/MazF family toxin [Actinomycetota bacterium]
MASTNEIWLCDFGEPYPGEPASLRPALILGPPETFGPVFPFVIVAPLTTSYRNLPLHIEVEPTAQSGLDLVSYVQCELIRSVNRQRLVHCIGAIGLDASNDIRNIIMTLLGY